MLNERAYIILACYCIVISIVHIRNYYVTHKQYFSLCTKLQGKKLHYICAIGTYLLFTISYRKTKEIERIPTVKTRDIYIYTTTSCIRHSCKHSEKYVIRY